MLYTMQLYVTFLPWGTSYLWIKKHVFVPSISRIPWKSVLSHLQIFLSILDCRAPSLCACTLWVFWYLGILPLSSGPDGLSCLLFFLVCAQSSPVLWNEYVGTAMLGGFSGWNVAMWLAIRSWTCVILALVFYLCTSGMLYVFPLYGFVTGERAPLSSGILWGLVWDGFRGAYPGVMVTFSFSFTLWHVAGSRDTVVVGCRVLLRDCGGSGVSNLGSCAGGGAGAWGTSMLKILRAS